MIECPNCHAKLPDWVQQCQFCQADTRGVYRAQPVVHDQRRSLAPAQWVWGAYYGISAYYILEGLYYAGTGVYGLMQAKSDYGTFPSVLGIIVGGVTAILGIGLLARIEAVRGIINFFCGLQILFGLFGLAGSLFGTLFLGPLGLLMLLMNLLQIATAVFMIYLIGETDRAAPNL